MNVAIVGAGSQSTPHVLASELLRTKDIRFVLIGRSEFKLESVARAMQSLAPKCALSIVDLTSLEDGLADADVVLLQVRFGGYRARAYDESFPPRFGIPGDEGLGPGGIANAWRSWPGLETLLTRILRARPQIPILSLVAPLGILTRCVLTRFPQARWHAACELPLTTLMSVSSRLRASLNDVRFDYAGVNHLGWFDRIGVPSEEDAIDRYASLANEEFPQGALIKSLHAIPLKYFRLQHEAAAVVAEQRAASRASELERLAVHAYDAFASGDASRVREALDRRPAPWYRFAVAPFIAAQAGLSPDLPLFLTARNNGYLQEIDNDDLLEVPHVWRAGAFRAVERSRPLSGALAHHLRRLTTCERAAARGVISRDPGQIKNALALHPWIERESSLDELTEAVCAQV